jgi:hypothetical protein
VQGVPGKSQKQNSAGHCKSNGRTMGVKMKTVQEIMSDKRLIDANVAIENADKCYEEWNLAMAAAEGNRQINMVYKKQELFKAVKKVVENCDTIDPKELLSTLWRNSKADPPKEDDSGQYGKVIVWYKGAEATLPMLWWMVEESADKYPWWMPMPEPPKEE